MRRLTITGFCAIALLSGCGAPQPKIVGKSDIGLPCNGKGLNTGKWHIGNSTTVVFHTDGRCKFIAPDFVSFDAPNSPLPLGFSDRVVDPNGKTVTYTYDPSKPIPDPPGYSFSYTNDFPDDGNGSGIVKN